MKKETIIETLLSNVENRGYYEKSYYFNDGEAPVMPLAAIFIWQHLRGIGDGYGLKNVEAVYNWLVEIKDQLIKYNMVPKNVGVRLNVGYTETETLWENYNF